MTKWDSSEESRDGWFNIYKPVNKYTISTELKINVTYLSPFPSPSLSLCVCVCVCVCVCARLGTFVKSSHVCGCVNVCETGQLGWVESISPRTITQKSIHGPQVMQESCPGRQAPARLGAQCYGSPADLGATHTGLVAPTGYAQATHARPGLAQGDTLWGP